MPFTNKLIAITGAASGIGRAMATLLSLAEIQRISDKRPITYTLDVRSQAACNAWIKGTLTRNSEAPRSSQTSSAEASGRTRGVSGTAEAAGINGGAFNRPYCASKHAVVKFTKALAKDEGARGRIRANAIGPGIKGIQKAEGTTELFGEKDLGVLERKVDAVEVAEVVVFLLEEGSALVTGAVVTVEGWWVC
ncbi:hypothetical protein BJY00DRAFT_315097 [Aspergillus carlsbadensis]|nr:hypothetical protein BJY00DRAFT_315097 [Aspergillus carlsbadensis]